MVKRQSAEQWRKILYENQDVPDNYVDESFLDELKKNLYIRTYDFCVVASESGVVTQQLSGVCLFVVVFIYMQQELLSPQLLFAATSALTVAGYHAYDKVDNGLSRRMNGRTRMDDLKTATLFMACGYGVSPVLMTLTKTISTDTIYAMTFFMFLANLLFHNYGANGALVSQSLSLNAGIFASVCLASRLPTTWHAFATVTLAVEMFALWPNLRRKIKGRYPQNMGFLTVLIGAATAVAIATISSVGAVLFSVLHIFISFMCPAWLIRMQPFKNNLYGPWDEAVIRD